MRKHIALVVILATCTMFLLPATGQAYGRKHGPCLGTGWWQRQPIQQRHEAVQQLIRCATDRYGVSFSTAHYYGHRESGVYLWPWARNRYSGACGVFQHLPRYWEGRVRAYLMPRWFGRNVWTDDNLVPCWNARANVLVAIKMARSGWGPWGG